MKRAFNLAFGTALSQLITIGMIPVLSRLNSPEVYGNFAIVLMYAKTISLIVNLKYELAIPLTKNDNHSKSLFKSIISLNIFLTFICLFITVFFNLIFNFDLWKWVIPILIGQLLGFVQAFHFFMVRENSFKLLGILKVIQSIFVATFSVIFSYVFLDSYLGLALGTFTGLILLQIVYFRKLDLRFLKIKKLKINQLISVDLLKKYKKFPIYVSPISIIDAGKDFIFLTFSSILFSPEITGIFFLTSKILIAPTSLIAGAISHVFMRDIAISVDETSLLFSQFKKLLLSVLLLGLFPLIFIFLFGNSLIINFLGDNWQSASTFIYPLSIFSFLLLPLTSLSMIPLILSRQGTASIFHISYSLIYISPLFLSYFFEKKLNESLYFMDILMGLHCVIYVSWLAKLCLNREKIHAI